jgi:hypothetical protein
MTYKGMLLSSLLIPIAFTCFGKDNVEKKIQQLKEKRYQKELELSVLGAKIAEKQELLEDMYDEAERFFEKYLRQEKLENNKVEDFSRADDAANEDLECRIKKAFIEGKFEGLLIKEFFNDKDDLDEDLEAERFYIVRHFFERGLLKTLFERYERCVQELIEIQREIESLQ